MHFDLLGTLKVSGASPPTIRVHPGKGSAPSDVPVTSQVDIEDSSSPSSPHSVSSTIGTSRAHLCQLCDCDNCIVGAATAADVVAALIAAASVFKDNERLGGDMGRAGEGASGAKQRAAQEFQS